MINKRHAKWDRTTEKRSLVVISRRIAPNVRAHTRFDDSALSRSGLFPLVCEFINVSRISMGDRISRRVNPRRVNPRRA